ncbi:glycosyl hydrolase catalytic core-domain-containing protein [Colletotrichum godetiae]|uniref:Glycosyl hydrolase catalytic core-domain-containing protein n=1 Tax=Colletotrichum godetiae TaxID=1209918 RepID=A0AAJ0ATJ8_9PEZI|nr:glycosyl hydrolase catalytic core-domain-containing protein [Colletotrichum godetiae]KAK1688580.1 glycosyl hydrolase catalytic core-domain-containing protein [Colletotrichum godetiae]
MYTKQALSVGAASLALVQQAMAFNAHRHIHQDKRALKIDVVTEWVTITVGGDESVPAATPTPTPTPTPQPAAPEAQYTPTTTSTSIVVIPTPTPTPVYATPSTTLVKSVAPKSSSQAPVAEAFSEAAVAVAAVPSTSSAKATASAVVSSSSNSEKVKKRGVAYNDPTKVNAFFSGTTQNCGWAYNWDSADNGITATGVDYVPMLWGPIDTHTARWDENAKASIKKGSTHILSFNECDMPSQCNLAASEAAVQHKKYMNSYKNDYNVTIGAPAITNSNIAGQGLDWLKAWVSACETEGCIYDFCVTHWYSPSTAADTLFSHLEAVHEACGGKPVWLTEFAPFGTTDEISSFVSTNVPKLESLSYLDRYSYFMASDGVLNSGSGLSALGQVYAAAASV